MPRWAKGFGQAADSIGSFRAPPASGATSLQGRSFTGHKTDREFAHYAEKADREAMAAAAMAKVVAGIKSRKTEK